MPFFSMVRRPRVETRRLTQRRSVSSQKRWVCRLGRKRRRFRLLAWETRLPTATRLPVTSQTRLIKVPQKVFKDQLVKHLMDGLPPIKGRSLYQPARGRATLPAKPVEYIAPRNRLRVACAGLDSTRRLLATP